MATIDDYAFCEAVTASGSSPWHIRELTPAGKKLSGGVDTPSLCGHVRPPYGWDLTPVVNLTITRACRRCADVLRARLGQEP